MKNRYYYLVIVLIVTTCIAPVASHAQSSVTLYGAFDTALGATTNAGKTNSSTRIGFVNGTIQTNSWGLRGTEVLGNGLNVIFNLQSAFNPSTGALSESNVEFRRRSYIGLASDTYGTILFGRQADPVSDALTPLTADLYFGSIFTTVGNVDNYDAILHINDSIKYVSPIYVGLQFEAMVALNGVPGSIASGGFYSAGISYTRGGLSIAGGYVVNKVANSTTLSNGSISTTASTTADGLAYDNPVVQFVSITSNEIGRIGGQYVYGSLIAGAAYSNSKFHQFGSNATLTFNSGSGFARYSLDASVSLAVGYSYTRASGEGASAKYNQVSFGSDYYFSKRTDVYIAVAYQRASGETLGNQGNLVPATATIGDEGFYGTSKSQSMALLGIRHRF